MKLAVNCMVRDDEATIYEALIAAGRVADQLVVVDTGSQDQTIKAIQAAQEYLSPKPFFFSRLDNIPDLTGFSYRGGSFCPSYKLADVRNIMIRNTTAEWIWVVDSDEIYTDRDATAVRKWIDSHGGIAEAGWVSLIWLCWDGHYFVTTSDPQVNTWAGRLFKRTPDLYCKNHFPGESYWRGLNQIMGNEPTSYRLILPDAGYRHYECITKPFRRRILNFQPWGGRLPEALGRRPENCLWRPIPKLPVPGIYDELNNAPPTMMPT